MVKETIGLKTSTIILEGDCNYDCYYCVGPGGRKKSRAPVLHDVAAIKRYYEMFQAAAASVLATSFHCRGTEPLIHPQFQQILRIALNVGTVNFRTNLSVPIQSHRPEGMKIFATLHPQAEEDLDGFTFRALDAMEKGVDVTVWYILHPLTEHKAANYQQHFSEKGIRFTLRSFHGPWDGKSYPDAYTDEQRRVLGICPRSSNPKLKKPPGKLCSAGWRSVWLGVTKQGTEKLYRCKRGELISRPLPAPAPCPRLGISCKGGR